MGSGPRPLPPLGLCLWLCVLVLSAGASGSSGVRKRGPTVTAKVTEWRTHVPSCRAEGWGALGTGIPVSGSGPGRGWAAAPGRCEGTARAAVLEVLVGGGGALSRMNWGAKARARARPRRRLFELDLPGRGSEVASSGVRRNFRNRWALSPGRGRPRHFLRRGGDLGTEAGGVWGGRRREGETCSELSGSLGRPPAMSPSREGPAQPLRGCGWCPGRSYHPCSREPASSI